jgi:hypothetical protein
VKRPLRLGVSRSDPVENLTSALYHTGRIRLHTDWVRQYVTGSALNASLAEKFAPDALLAALAIVEQETQTLRALFTREAA